MSKPKNFFRNLIRPFSFSSSKDGQNEEDLEKIAAQEQKNFPYEVLVSATKNFNSAHKLGEGGFGPVYKGKLDDGREIAVKKLSHSSNQGKKEFENEAKLLARVQHRNIVNLLGYCVHGTEKLLVYEYVVNESLDKLLFKSNRSQELDWKRRDIKASNILLDDKWIPKIADFGMARLFPEDRTHVNTRVAGTNGYMAPEYVMHGNLSVKADVFSFGVVVLELISGHRNSNFNLDVDAQNLLDWAYKLYKKGRSLEIVDPKLADSGATDQIAMCIQIGLLCTQGDPKLRPLMRRVAVLLTKKPGHLEEPSRPGVPGSRYRRARRPAAMSSSTLGAGGSSGESDSRTYDTSLNSNTASASTSALSSPRQDRHGKRPMQS
ncbi:hypothetical protein Q3G72_010871 [Acer saccharum]|nr:hypothetical protein Q3G72_010871 [Acer saccharum]